MTFSSHVTGLVRSTLRLEGLAVLVLSVLVYSRTDLGAGRFAALFLLPDLSFLGYLAGPRAGATAYNAAHSLLGPLLLAALALVFGVPTLLPYLCIWTSHIGFDRALGYGLKYGSAFGHTHLGVVGRATVAPAATTQAA